MYATCAYSLLWHETLPSSQNWSLRTPNLDLARQNTSLSSILLKTEGFQLGILESNLTFLTSQEFRPGALVISGVSITPHPLS